MSPDERSITVSRSVAAPPERVFALLADPTRHVELDGSGMMVRTLSPEPIRAAGQVFLVAMHNDRLGDYTVANSVVAFTRDEEIGWAPGLVGRAAPGHTYTFRLAPAGGGTELTQVYDWSAVTDADILSRMPRVGRDQLADSMDRIAAAVA